MTELDAEQIREAVKDGTRAAHEEAGVFGFERLRRAYERLHADYDPSEVRKRRRNMNGGDDDGE